MWRRHAPTVFVEPSRFDNSPRRAPYVKWKKENGRWVIEEIGWPGA